MTKTAPTAPKRAISKTERYGHGNIFIVAFLKPKAYAGIYIDGTIVKFNWNDFCKLFSI